MINEITRDDIHQLGEKVLLTDEDKENNLQLFNYLTCGESDDQKLKQCRGVVFNGDNLILKAFTYTNEYALNQKKKITAEIGSDANSFEKIKFFDSYEGALIRMFYFNNKWYSSTHKKLNAKFSKWSSKKSFGEILEQSIEKETNLNPALKSALDSAVGETFTEKLQSTLNKENKYMFLICNTNENRIVCYSNEAKSSVYHVGTFFKDSSTVSFEDEILIKKPNQLKNICSIDDIDSYVDTIDIWNQQGIIGFHENGRVFKIYNDQYNELFQIRGNEPSIRFRYLQLRMDCEKTKTLKYLYPDFKDDFDKYENTLYDIAKKIYKNYVDRFIKKEFITVPKDQFFIMKKCHEWHVQDKVNNRINLNVVQNCMNLQTPTFLNHLIRNFSIDANPKQKRLIVPAAAGATGAAAALPAEIETETEAV